MSRPDDRLGTPVQPTLADLMARYLERQTNAHVAGLGRVDTAGEVVPFEASPVQPVDPRLAWDGALAAVRFFQPKLDAAITVPADWAALVAAYEPVVAVPLCVGNFPQMVRNLYALMHETRLSSLRPTANRPVGAAALTTWAEQQARTNAFPQTLLAVSVLRLAREYDRAAELLASHRSSVPAEWCAAWANEEAALAWHRGKAEAAAALWQAQKASVPVLFNRGMAGLFLDQPAEARTCLAKAVAQVPEDNPWHHLGQLYLALAEMRGR